MLMMLMMTGDSCLDWLIQQGPRLLPLTRPPLHPLGSWCFPVTGCVVCPKQNDTEQTLDAARLWRKRHTFNDCHKPSTHKPNSMSCSPGEEEQSTFRRRSCSQMTVCWMGLVCVCNSRGLVRRLRIMNTSSSTVTMAAKSIPPMAAPITAGYTLWRGSAATHHSHTLQDGPVRKQQASHCVDSFNQWINKELCLVSP